MAIDLKEEMRILLARADAEEEVKECVIEPCPICGGEMEDGCMGPEHVSTRGKCPYCSSYSVEAHNAMARLIKEADSWTRGFMSTSYEGLRDAMCDLRVLQDKVREESE